MSATAQQVQALFDDSRNGCNGYIRHPLARRLIYTDGVQALADLAGAYWMLDVIGTEAVPKLLAAFSKGDSPQGIIQFKVADSKGVFRLTTRDGAPPIWEKGVPFTDFPEGDWHLYLFVDQMVDQRAPHAVLLLPSEN